MSIDVMFEHILRNVGGMHMPFSDNLYRLRKGTSCHTASGVKVGIRAVLAGC